MTTRLEKPVRRVVNIGGLPYVVEISRAGVLFRRQGHHHKTAAPWSGVLKYSERLAGEELHRENLRSQAIKRFARVIMVAVAFANSTSCSVLDELGPRPPAKRCPARDTIVAGKLPDSIVVVRGCP